MNHQKIIPFLILSMMASTSLAQTNTFPASGNVGIGITSPAFKLHVKGDVRFERLSGGNNYLQLYSDAGGSFLISDDTGVNQKPLYFRVVSANSTDKARPMYFQTGIKGGATSTRMTILNNGNIGIGTSSPQAKLAVNGNILAKEVKVKTDISVPDYVFEADYELTRLSDLETFVRKHKHLPEIPSAADIQREGLDLAEMNLLLLKKVEELTLHLIEKEKIINEQNKRIRKIEDYLNDSSE